MNTFRLESFTQSDNQIVTNESNLSICPTANGFIFAIIDRNFRLNALGEFVVDLTGSMTQTMTNLKACFSSIGVHIFNFKHIRIVCPSERNTWIPFKLYDNTKDREYLRTVAPIYSNDKLISNVSQKMNAVEIFAYSLQLYSAMKILIPKAHFVSPSFVLGEYAFDVSSFMQNTLILNKRSVMDFVVFKGNTFTLANSFDYKTADDLIYFILFTLQQLNINTAEVNMLLTGDDYTSEEIHLLKRYVKHVSYANPLENVCISSEFDGINLQKYFLLLA